MTTLALLFESREETDRRKSFSSETLFVSTEKMTMDSLEEEGKLPAVGVVGVDAVELPVFESLLQLARYLASLVGFIHCC